LSNKGPGYLIKLIINRLVLLVFEILGIRQYKKNSRGFSTIPLIINHCPL